MGERWDGGLAFGRDSVSTTRANDDDSVALLGPNSGECREP